LIGDLSKKPAAWRAFLYLRFFRRPVAPARPAAIFSCGVLAPLFAPLSASPADAAQSAGLDCFDEKADELLSISSAMPGQPVGRG
jgi:hypothetical protein